MYAIFQDGSHQYKVAEGDQLDVDYRDAPVGEQIAFDHVLLYKETDEVRVGSPTVADAKVVAEVLEQVKGEKIRVEKFRRRKNYHRRYGHRQKLTRIRIIEILIPTRNETSKASEN